MTDWLERQKPGPKPKTRKRTTINATVHPNVYDFLEQYKEEHGVGASGRLLDKLISSKFPHVKIGEINEKMD